MIVRIEKWGNSLAIRIPEEIVKSLNLKEDMSIKIEVKDGGLAMRRPARLEYSLKELVAQITPQNLHGETDWDPPIGREVLEPYDPTTPNSEMTGSPPKL